ncbi:hypothetical protein ACHQM5_022897 [Ranunculus cassubicifolius]
MFLKPCFFISFLKSGWTIIIPTICQAHLKSKCLGRVPNKYTTGSYDSAQFRKIYSPKSMFIVKASAIVKVRRRDGSFQNRIDVKKVHHTPQLLHFSVTYATLSLYFLFFTRKRLICKGCGEALCDSLFSAPIQGYMLGILSACLSALAGVYTEFLMKKNNDSLYWQNVQLYTFGAIFNMVKLLLDDFRGGPWWQRLLDGYSLTTWLVVLNLGSTGLLVSWLMKYADNIVKVIPFSLSSLDLIYQISSIYDADNFSVHMYFAPPTMLVDLPVPPKTLPETVKDVSDDQSDS